MAIVMVNSPQAYQEWLRVVINKMSHVSKSQAIGLAMWSLAIAMTHSCGLSTVTVFLGQILSRKENKIRKQLKQWYREKNQKYGRKRQQIDVSQSFTPLLTWMFKLVPTYSTVDLKFGELVHLNYGKSCRKLRQSCGRVSLRSDRGYLLALW